MVESCEMKSPNPCDSQLSRKFLNVRKEKLSVED